MKRLCRSLVQIHFNCFIVFCFLSYYPDQELTRPYEKAG